jgi:hypothetical protein
MQKTIKTAIACAIFAFALNFQACKKDMEAQAEVAFSSCKGETNPSVANMESKIIGKFVWKHSRSYDQIGNKGMIYGSGNTSYKLDIRADHSMTIQADGKCRNAEWEIVEVSFLNDPKRYVLREKNTGGSPNIPSGDLILCDKNIMFSSAPVDASDLLYVRE